MLPNDSHLAALMSQNLSTQTPKTTITKNRHDFAARQRNLFGNSASGGDRFYKHCFVVGDMIGNDVQVAVWHNDRICKRTVVGDDADDRPIWAVIGQISSAHRTGMTRAVDFANNTLPGESSGTRDADKFMSQRTAESHVPLAKLQICFADSGLDDIYDDVVGAGLSEVGVCPVLQCLVEDDGSHDVCSGTNLTGASILSLEARASRAVRSRAEAMERGFVDLFRNVDSDIVEVADVVE